MQQGMINAYRAILKEGQKVSIHEMYGKRFVYAYKFGNCFRQVGEYPDGQPDTNEDIQASTEV